MREEKLFRAIGQVDGDLIEEAATAGPGKRTAWWKYGVLVASVVIVIAVGLVVGLQKGSDSEVAKETEGKMDFTIVFDGMGYEGIMGYEMLEQGNPWKETDEISTLPIFENNSCYAVETYPNDVNISQERYEEMEAWASEVAAFLGMEEYTEDRNTENVIAESEAIRIKVDGDMKMRIKFLSPVSLPEKYNTSIEATMEETYALAEYILAEYGEIFGLKNPQIAVIESDYNIYGERYHHDIRFYEEGSTAAETVVNYYFDYASFILNETGELWFIDITHKDKIVLAECDVISVDEAVDDLLNGEYATSYYGDTVPTEEYIRDVELTYYMSFWDDYKPYYRFWVEVPEEKRENGLNTYVAYYVPAVEGAYLEITFN